MSYYSAGLGNDVVGFSRGNYRYSGGRFDSGRPNFADTPQSIARKFGRYKLAQLNDLQLAY